MKKNKVNNVRTFARDYVSKHLLDNNNSKNFIRISALFNSLTLCDCDSDVIRLLVNKIMVLQNQVEDLQAMYTKLQVKYDSLIHDFF